jgi:hypothetical protein
MKDRAHRQWTIKSSNGWLYNVHGTRREAIRSFLGNDPTQVWAWWRRKYGIRAVRVSVREL